MAYHINAEDVSLEDLQKRLVATDLIPSRVSLLEDLAVKLKALEKQGITTLADLREALKNPKRLAAVAEATGIDAQYLVLLRREIEGYFPKPVALITFDWLPIGDIEKLKQKGISDTAKLYEAAGTAHQRTELAKLADVSMITVDTLTHLADLTRVQWVSPNFARMLIAAGCDSAANVAAANAETLCKAVEGANAGNIYFKGKIGLRDIKRLILAASYVD